MMFDGPELERLRHILRKEATGWASDAERQELRDIINRHTGKAARLPWHALLQVAQYTVRLYSEEADATGAEA